MGEVFAGRYELIDPIASGGMGTVWRVVDRADGVVKAAKILRQSDAGMLLRFVREQSMRIDHSHVVAPQSWAGVDDRVLFTMPLVRGGSVADLMKTYGALSPRWIGPLLDQTLQALEAVHAAGIVHRDIKPGNLLLEPTGRATPHLRLTDFGIAVPADEPRLTTIASTIGTPGYMPPEAYYGADPDPSGDIYAVGMVAYEMLTGQRPPTTGPDAPPLPLDALRTGDAFHDAVVDVVAVATAYDPAARPTAAQLRAHPALGALLHIAPDPDDPIEVVDVYPDPPPMTTPPPPPPPGGTSDRYAAAGWGTAPTVHPPPPPPRRPSWPNASTEDQPAPTSMLPPGSAPPMPAAMPVPAPPAGATDRPGVVLPLLMLVLGLLGLVVSAWLLLG